MSRNVLVVALLILGLGESVAEACHRCHHRRCNCVSSSGRSSGVSSDEASAIVAKHEAAMVAELRKKAEGANSRETGSDGGIVGGGVQQGAASDQISARLERVENRLGLPHTVNSGESGLLGGDLVAGIIGEVFRDVAPSLIEDFRTRTRQKFNLPPAAVAPVATGLTKAELDLSLANQKDALKKELLDDLKAQLPEVMRKTLADDPAKFKTALGI